VSDLNGQSPLAPTDLPTRYPRRRWAVLSLFAAGAAIAAVLTASDNPAEHVLSIVLIVSAIIAIYLLYDSLLRAKRRLEELGRANLMYEAARRLSRHARDGRDLRRSPGARRARDAGRRNDRVVVRPVEQHRALRLRLGERRAVR
jgi:hypothetical protein